MKKIHLYPFLIAAFAMMSISCSSRSEKDIESRQASGVALVQNQSFYEVRLSNGESLYFSHLGEDGEIQGLSFSRDSVDVATSFGTAFFVSDKGMLATNAHVVSSMSDDKDINRSIGKVIESLKAMVKYSYNNKLDQLQQLEYAFQVANYSPEISYTDFYTIRNARDEAQEELREMEKTYRELSYIRPSDSKIIYHNQVAIAYNDTHVTKTTDFTDCVVIASDPDHDLALIQLKDKKTPSGKYIFRIEDSDPLETYSFFDKIESRIKDDKNSRLYMYGFNLGPALALTEDGLKAQFTNGTVSQKTSDRLMYTIPALRGSSGSPVVNHKGELVAINFAGIEGTQNFNYGVRVKHLKVLLDRYN